MAGCRLKIRRHCIQRGFQRGGGKNHHLVGMGRRGREGKGKAKEKRARHGTSIMF